MSTFQLQEFDRDDSKNVGRPNYFSLDDYFDLIQQYITCDEIIKARWLLDNPPEWYCENMPAGSAMIRERLYKQLFTSLQYAKDGCRIEDIVNQSPSMLKAGVKLERGWLAHGVVKEINDAGERPWVFELAPGNYWLPFMMKEHDLKFDYYGPSLNVQMQHDACDNLHGIWMGQPLSMPRQPRVFIAFELLEHLYDTEEIFHHYVKAGGDFDTILLSTPKGVYGGGRPDWHNADLGHLRCYMPRSFLAFAQKHWPSYKWQLYDGPVMMLKGDKV